MATGDPAIEFRCECHGGNIADRILHDDDSFGSPQKRVARADALAGIEDNNVRRAIRCSQSLPQNIKRHKLCFCPLDAAVVARQATAVSMTGKMHDTWSVVV